MPRPPVMEVQSDRDRLEAWRCDQLVRAGYSLPTAELLSRLDLVDWRLAVRLRQTGCAEKLALKILL